MKIIVFPPTFTKSMVDAIVNAEGEDKNYYYEYFLTFQRDLMEKFAEITSKMVGCTQKFKAIMKDGKKGLRKGVESSERDVVLSDLSKKLFNL